MCSGPDNNSKIKLTPPGFGVNESQKKSTASCSIMLLEFSAFDDIASFKRAVEEEGAAIDEAGLWYGRRTGLKKMGMEERTPLMIASMFGSVDVLKYILARGGVDVNRACGSDGATALHCAAAGGSAAGAEIVKLLIAASADVEAVDAAGNRPGDVIATASPAIKQRTVEVILKGGREEASLPASPTASASSEDNLQMEQASEKKEYPIDLSLPDIKNGIYGTDEFRMYTFKVKPCSRAYSHDWTECPFVHPGENARRRDPRKYHYSCVPCPEFRKGSCRQGDACEYAHGVFECWLHPAQYRTRLCKDETNCTRRVCFFAHKKEELRPLYASTGSAVPSPRSSGAGVSPLDMASMSPLSLGGSQSMLMMPTSTPPMSPSSSPSAIGGAAWQTQLPPTLQLPGSRLKATLSARDLDLDLDLVGMDGQQQQLMDEISNLSGRQSALTTAAALAALSGSRSGKFNHINAVTPTNLDEIFGSVDSSSLSQLQGLQLKVAAAAAAASAAQYQSGASSAAASLYQTRQNLNQQLQSSFGSSMASSPSRASSSFGLDPSSAVAAAVMNSRAAAFAKRSQSFSERAAVSRHPGLTAMATTSSAASPILSDWGSPNGKVDWGIQGEELHKLRKSASFAIRSSGSVAPAAMTVGTDNMEEPDVSWVQSLVKDAPSTSSGWLGLQQEQQKFRRNDEFHASEMLPSWAEQQLYMEQEQMVA